MRGRPLILLFACFVSLPLWAQDASTFNGNWSASFPSPNGRPMEVKIVIANGAGTWQILAKNRNDECVGREFPLTLDNATADGVELVVSGSKALQGCQDFVWHAKRVDDKSFAGEFKDGRKFVMTRN